MKNASFIPTPAHLDQATYSENFAAWCTFTPSTSAQPDTAYLDAPDPVEPPMCESAEIDYAEFLARVVALHEVGEPQPDPDADWDVERADAYAYESNMPDAHIWF